MTAEGASILVVAALPPPLHGQSLVTAALVRRLRESGLILAVVDTSPRGLRRGVAYHARRMWGVSKGIFWLLSHSRRANKTVYTVMEAGFGVAYTAIICVVARLLRNRLIVHHHTGGYLRNSSRMRSWIFDVVGASGVNVVLSRDMAADLEKNYSPPGRTYIAHNAAYLSPAELPKFSFQAGALRVGMISNLTEEKGILEVERLARLAVARDIPFDLILAGPAGDRIASEVIARTASIIGTRFRYIGPVYGDAKVKFFEALDVLIFPSTYAHEAQPITLLEGMAYGLCVISRDVGYCAELLGQGGTIIPTGESFGVATIEFLAQLSHDRRVLAQHQRAARQRFEDLKEDADFEMGELIKEMTGFSVRPQVNEASMRPRRRS